MPGIDQDSAQPVRNGTESGETSLEVNNPNHNDLQCNANLQVGDADNAVGNPAFVAPGTGATWAVTPPAGGMEAIQDTHDDLNANVNLQVGDADVANGNPVPVSDAGGTLTVDSASHDSFPVNANLMVGDADNAVGNPAFVSPGTGATWDVVPPVGGMEVVQDTHDDLNANVNLQVGDADVGAANPVPVTVVSAVPGVPLNEFGEADGVGVSTGIPSGGGEDMLEFFASETGNFNFNELMATASGKLKIEVWVDDSGEPLTAPGIVNVRAGGTLLMVGFNSTSNPNIHEHWENDVVVAGATKSVYVIFTNRDNQPMSAYCKVGGFRP